MNELSPASPSPTVSAASSAWASLRIGLVLAIILTALVAATNNRIPGPMIQADEGSYLANAAAIAGYENDLASSYHAGYSLLISPAFRLTHGPDAIWDIILLVNAALYFLLCLAMWLLAGRLAPGADRPRDRILPVLLVCAYPMWVAMAGYAFSQLAFVTAFAWAALFLSKAVEGNRWCDWLLFSLLAGYTYWIHPTGLVVVIAAFLACMTHACMSRQLARPTAAMACAVLVAMAYRYFFAPWLRTHMTLGGPPNMHYPGIKSTLQALISDLDTLVRFFQHISGHLFYLIIGTVGVFVLGILELVCRMRASNAAQRGSAWAPNLFILLSPLGILALSALMFSTSDSATRLDHWIYGRYMEGALAPLLLVGTYHRAWRQLGWGIPFAALTAWGLSLGMLQYDGIAPFNIPALWQQFQPSLQGIWRWFLAGSALIALAAVLGKRIGMILVIGVFGFAGWWQIHWHQSLANNEVPRWRSARYIRAHYPPGTCVGFDLDSAGADYGKRVFWFDYGFQLYDYGPRRMSAQQWARSCNGPLFSYSPSVGSAGDGIEAMVASPKNGPMLWSDAPPPLKYPLHVSSQSLEIKQVLGTGWHEVETDHVWSTRQASLHLPVPGGCTDTQCLLRLKFDLYAASAVRPVQITLVTPSPTGEQRTTRTYDSPGPHTLEVTFAAAGRYADITLLAPDAVSPKSQGESSDSRELGLSLRSVGLGIAPAMPEIKATPAPGLQAAEAH